MVPTANLPPGRYAVAVSGGADSVALLRLLHTRGEPALHVVHLDHQLRGEASDGDARFVADLAEQLGLSCTIARRNDIEPMHDDWPNNPSARYRAMRLALFRRVIAEHGLDGICLAHHADDQAETLAQRLLRGSGPGGLIGMAPDATVGGVRIVRPLLEFRASALRTYLCEINQAWREDASNQSPRYARNRLRRWLSDRPEITTALLELGAAARALAEWIGDHQPKLDDSFPVGALDGWPAILRRAAMSRWLIERGCPADGLPPPVIARLMTMRDDAAAPARMDFPGGVSIRRRRGMISTERNLPMNIYKVKKRGRGGP